MMDLNESKRQSLFQSVNHRSGAAVAGIDHQLQGPHSCHIHIGQQMPHIVGHHIHLAHRSHLLCRGGVAPRHGPVLDFPQTAVAADGPGSGPNQLQAVVVHGIVTGRHHDTAVRPEMERGEIHLLRAAQTDVQHMAACVGEPLNEMLGQLMTRQPHITADDDLLRPQMLRIGPADAVHQPAIQLIRHASADIIGLESRPGKLRHAPSLHPVLSESTADRHSS